MTFSITSACYSINQFCLISDHLFHSISCMFHLIIPASYSIGCMFYSISSTPDFFDQLHSWLFRTVMLDIHQFCIISDHLFHSIIWSVLLLPSWISSAWFDHSTFISSLVLNIHRLFVSLDRFCYLISSTPDFFDQLHSWFFRSVMLDIRSVFLFDQLYVSFEQSCLIFDRL